MNKSIDVRGIVSQFNPDKRAGVGEMIDKVVECLEIEARYRTGGVHRVGGLAGVPATDRVDEMSPETLGRSHERANVMVRFPVVDAYSKISTHYRF
jgi:hypothetical protein